MRIRDSGGGKRSQFKDQGDVAAELYPRERRSRISREMTTGLLPYAAAGPSSCDVLGVFS
jgi:hypothetical protein